MEKQLFLIASQDKAAQNRECAAQRQLPLLCAALKNGIEDKLMSEWQAIAQYLDESGCVTTWPSKRNRKAQRLVLQYLLSKFDPTLFYTEKQVNYILNQYHRFQDPALLRRAMFEAGLLNRKLDGSAYWIPFDVL